MRNSIHSLHTKTLIAELYAYLTQRGMNPPAAVDQIVADWNEDATLESERITRAEVEQILDEHKRQPFFKTIP